MQAIVEKILDRIADDYKRHFSEFLELGKNSKHLSGFGRLKKMRRLCLESYKYYWLSENRKVAASGFIFNDLSSLENYFTDPSLRISDYPTLLFYVLKGNCLSGILNYDVKFKLQSSVKATGLYSRELFEIYTKKFKKGELGSEEKLRLGQLKLGNPIEWENPYLDAIFLKNEERNIVKSLNFESNALLIPKKFAEFVEAHQLIKEHYFDKEDSFDKDDIAYVIKALKLLEISEFFVVVIQEYLIKIMNKIKNKKSNIVEKEISVENVCSSQIEDVIISNKDVGIKNKSHNVILRELNQYFNFDEMKPITYLSLNKIIYCVSLLKSIGYSEEGIKLFVSKSEKFNRNLGINPIYRYVDLRKKILYYSGTDARVKEILDDLEVWYGLRRPAINEDYEIAKDNMSRKLIQLYSALPDTLEYEEQMVLTLEKK